MALKIRLKRMGKKNLPFYRLVVVDSRWRRDGKSIADLGWYDPVKNPAQMMLKESEIYSWLEKGAQLTETSRSLLKQRGILDAFKTGAYKESSAETPTEINETGVSAAEPVAAVQTETVAESAQVVDAEPPVEEPQAAEESTPPVEEVQQETKTE